MLHIVIFRAMRIFAAVIALAVTVSFAHAQAKPAATKPAVYTVTLGGFRDANIPAVLFKRIVDSALTVRDDKGNSYPVVRFRINYTFANTFKDSETQQLKTFRDFRAADFYDTNRLPEVWTASLKDNARKDDEVILNNVIIRLKNGKKLMVPEWRGKLK
jgi:uncharacterized protein YdeI (BOF family)